MPLGRLLVSNVMDGISITDAPTTIVGGPVAGSRNLLSGNRIGVALVRASGTVIQGNLIGTDVSGTLAVGNAFGVSVNTSSNCIIGGTEVREGNVIRFNAGFGVAVNAESVSTRILGNAISDNTGLGIDLVPLGLTANDAGDGDGGANNLQNFPVLTAAGGGGTGHAQQHPETPRSASSSSVTRPATRQATAKARRSWAQRRSRPIAPATLRFPSSRQPRASSLPQQQRIPRTTPRSSRRAC